MLKYFSPLEQLKGAALRKGDVLLACWFEKFPTDVSHKGSASKKFQEVDTDPVITSSVGNNVLTVRIFVPMGAVECSLALRWFFFPLSGSFVVILLSLAGC